MTEDRRTTISSSSLSPEDVARHTFGSVRRGFSPDEVRGFLESVADQLRVRAERERQLVQALEEAEHRAANPVLDEETLAAALGHETSRVLRSAHEASHEMVDKATAQAERILAEAHQEIADTEAKVSSQLAERVARVEESSAETRSRAEAESTAALELARSEGEGIIAQARTECRDMIEEAQGLRSRVLADLSRRRKVLHAQIEQLRAGRERLAETVRDVRRSIDSIADELFRAEDEARMAAEAAGREAIARADDGSLEELAVSLAAEEADPMGGALTYPAEGGSEVDLASDLGSTEGGPVDVVPADELSVTDEPFGDPIVGLAEPVPDSVPDEPEPLADVADVTDAGDEDPEGALAPDPSVDEPDSTADAPGPSVDEPEPLAESAVVADVTDVGDEDPTGAVAPEPMVNALFAKLRASTEVEPEPEGTDDDGPPVEPSPLVGSRDGLTAPVVTALSRRLKRTFQDDQNEILDRLRSHHFTWSADILPDELEHLDSYSTAVLPYLEEAAEAGASFVGSEGIKGPSIDELLGIAHELAESVVLPLRRRLSDADRLDQAEESEVSEHVGSAFREWKGERVERLAGDFVTAAFSAGSIAGIGGQAGARFVWTAVAQPDAEPCPDCGDNSLDGPQLPGDPFPTGHARPPAHPGCRCLLVPSAT